MFFSVQVAFGAGAAHAGTLKSAISERKPFVCLFPVGKKRLLTLGAGCVLPQLVPPRAMAALGAGSLSPLPRVAVGVLAEQASAQRGLCGLLLSFLESPRAARQLLGTKVPPWTVPQASNWQGSCGTPAHLSVSPGVPLASGLGHAGVSSVNVCPGGRCVS